jgi:hypothetical protein
MCIFPQDNKENKDEEENQVSEAPKQKMFVGKSNYNSKVIFISSFFAFCLPKQNKTFF